MKLDVYDFSDPIDLVNALILEKSEVGYKSKIARHLGCHGSFVSQVLNHKAMFSLEQSLKLSRLFSMTPNQRDFFILLAQQKKAGSVALSEFYQEKIDSHRMKRREIRKRVGVGLNSREDVAMLYYQNWWTPVIHILSAFDEINSTEDIATYLGITEDTVETSLVFLKQENFVTRTTAGLEIGKSRIHLPSSKSIVGQFHSNFRMLSLAKIANTRPSDLRYSSILGISQSSFEKLKSKILNLIENFEPELAESKIELPVCFNIDCFKI